MSLNILLMSDETIKERTAVHGNTDPQLLYPDIKVAQDMYVLPILGTALYTVLQTAVNTNNWTDKETYKELLDNYIVDALMYHTLAELPFTLGYQFWNKGIVRKQGQDTELPSMSDLVDISNRNRDKAQFYTKRLQMYLLEDNGRVFPEYNSPGNGLDTVRPDTPAYDIGIYLGDDECGCIDHGLRKPYNNA